MGAYAALLRGINVSGHNMIKMADLKLVLADLGFQQLSTYLQSGNLVFEAELTSCIEMEKIIATAISTAFGLEIKVKVIPKDRFQQGFLNNPFTKNRENDTKQLYYIHLMGLADVATFKQLQNDDHFPEQMSLLGEVIYVHYVNGYGRSKLHAGILEKKLKVSATARNHNTMKHLSQMLDSL